MKSSPRVSVIMPVYNAESFLREAIDSVLTQSHSDFELIIVDDGSTDCSGDIINDYADKRIMKHKNETNMGIVPTRNVCTSLAKGEYIALLDADDICFPRRLEKQLSFFDLHPDVGILGTGFQVINENGKTLASYKFPEHHHLITWSLFFFSPLANSTIMMRTPLLKDLGGYMPGEGSVNAGVEDYDLWFRAADHTRISNLPETLVQIRKHEMNITSVHSTIHYENVFRLAHRGMSELIGRELPYEGVVRIRKNQALGSDLWIITELYRAFINSRELTKIDKKEIKCDASQRLLMSWRSLIKDQHFHNAIWDAMKMNPLCVVQFFIEKILSRSLKTFKQYDSLS